MCHRSAAAQSWQTKAHAFEQIVSAKYQRGAAANEALLLGITESSGDLNLSELMREPLPPTFHRLVLSRVT
jgi:hypothetical protein